MVDIVKRNDATNWPITNPILAHERLGMIGIDKACIKWSQSINSFHDTRISAVANNQMSIVTFFLQCIYAFNKMRQFLDVAFLAMRQIDRHDARSFRQAVADLPQ